jgi:hypothetical protein
MDDMHPSTGHAAAPATPAFMECVHVCNVMTPLVVVSCVMPCGCAWPALLGASTALTNKIAAIHA